MLPCRPNFSSFFLLLRPELDYSNLLLVLEIMNRRSSNEREIFTSTTTAHTREMLAALRNKRADRDKAWDAVDDGWKQVEKRMVAIGITKPVSLDDAVVPLNVGGLHFNLRRVDLETLNPKGANPIAAWTLANLFDGVWDTRVPRNEDNRIVFDESPAVFKHFFNTQLKASNVTPANMTSRDTTDPAFLAADQKGYLFHFSSFYWPRMLVMGGSSMLNTDQFGVVGSIVRGLCPSDPRCLELVYSGSRHGMNANAFHKRCTDKYPSTLTLVEVKHSGTSSGSSLIVGGFSSVSWASTGEPSTYHSVTGEIPYHTKHSPGAFMFFANDVSATDKKEGYNVQGWALSQRQAVVRCGTHLGPDFGVNGFKVSFSSPCKLFPGASCILPIDCSGLKVSDVEVYRVCSTPSSPTAIDGSGPPEADHDVMDAGLVDNIHVFGASIGGALIDEITALKNVQAELVCAEKRVEAAARALAAVYGPDVASGKDDPVIELKVRGKRITTLASTLQACKESALAARFEELYWPPDGNYFGVIDCRPSIFSKVLDVLRIRKREKWSQRESHKGIGVNVVSKVSITADDQASFKEFVGMHFSGCEGFVMDMVEFQNF